MLRGRGARLLARPGALLGYDAAGQLRAQLLPRLAASLLRQSFQSLPVKPLEPLGRISQLLRRLSRPPRPGEMASPSRAPLVWIDCEMTGLDLDKDTIMSLCCIVTDADLNVVDEKGFDAVIHHDQPALDAMGEWCTKHHGDSGLTAACLASTTSAEQAAGDLLRYIQQFTAQREALLAGNSVHVDRQFLSREPYKRVVNHLSYRILDVSSIKEAARRWADPQILTRVPRKKGLHEARADIVESIEEARFYRQTFFKPPSEHAEQQQ